MASSTEPTDTPIPHGTGATPPGYQETGWIDAQVLMDKMEKATTLLTNMALEVDKLREAVRCLTDENARLKATIRELRYPYEPHPRGR